jgi:hypothetical protein
MSCRRLGILGAFAFLPAFAQVASVPPSQATKARMTTRYLGPIRDLFDQGDGTGTSLNWSGYAVLGASFTKAEGSWIVPKAKCTGVTGAQYSAMWVGLDGATPTSPTVEQTGTLSDCNGSSPQYFAWFEFYPSPLFELTGFPVRPGDKMFASVVYTSTTAEFTVKITNKTTGRTFSKSQKVPTAIRSTAEWIAEAPCCTSTGGILPLADFGTWKSGFDSTAITGTDDATDTSNSGPIGSFPAVNTMRIDKVGSTTSPQESNCSALSTDKTSFSCTWQP